MSNKQAPRSPRKTDRRIERTRRLLSEALISLILERGYDTITVQDITDQANLSRATFYLHYRDKEELLLASLQTIYDGLTESIRAFQMNDILDDRHEPMLLAFQHAAENRDLYRVMLRARSANAVTEGIRTYAAERILESLERTTRYMTLRVPREVVAHHMAASLIGLITWWLEDAPFARYTPAQMASLYQVMNGASLMRAIGVDPDNLPKSL
jgi:AcrR family transcriptional regulator